MLRQILRHSFDLIVQQGSSFGDHVVYHVSPLIQRVARVYNYAQPVALRAYGLDDLLSFSFGQRALGGQRQPWGKCQK